MFIFPAFVLAAPSSATYQLLEGGTDSSSHSSSSTNYEIDGSIEYFVGRPTSTNYAQESGVPLQGPFCGDGEVSSFEQCDGSNLNSQTCVTRGFGSGTLACSSDCTFNTSGCTSGGGGGGGGGVSVSRPSSPTIDSSISTASYASTVLLHGVKDASVNVYVNDSLVGVTYPTTTTWQQLANLAIGNNTFTVKSTNSAGASGTNLITIVRYEKPMGDVTSDNVVNDYDLSILAYYWGKSYAGADFNSDGIVDDYDLSMLAAFWDRGA